MSLPAVSPFPQRETMPPGFAVRSWEEESDYRKLEQSHAQWLEENAGNEQLFQRHVYEKDSPEEGDFREHRRRLYKALAWGEALAMGFLQAAESGSAAYVSRIDQTLDALRAVLHEWHGPINDPGVPASLRQGFHEAQHRLGLEPL